MTPSTIFARREVAVFGLGGSGLATAASLLAGGAHPVVWDDNEASRDKAASAGLDVVDLNDVNWARFGALVLAPGVPLTHPRPHWTVERARDAGLQVIGDVELFCRERAKMAPRAPFIAITGTNGKSTTTALIAHILRTVGCDVALGGNLGTPILALDPPSAERFHVIELSSFQIDLTPSLKPTLGLLLNLSPDHIDRHGTMENYAAVKARLVQNSDNALISVDDPLCWQIGQEISSAAPAFFARGAVPVSVERELDWGVFAQGTQILSRRTRRPPAVIADVADIPTLRGKHNLQNAAFAAAAADTWSLPDGAIQAGLSSFPGLPHRMEEVGRLGAALFINDSKATNADATERALASFDDIFWILGGRPKEGGIRSLGAYFPRIQKAYLIGEAAADFAATLDGHVPYEMCGTLDVAAATAAADAGATDLAAPVVLLSPACASYDQYRSYEQRGDDFRALVAAITEGEP